jgi:beta-lactamase regulating signal transducer with metallopeptidase domain
MSVEALLSALGAGVVLAWLALPAFAALAGQSRGAAPPAYHRALVLALALGTCASSLPLLRAAWVAWSGASALDTAGFAPLAPLRVVGRWVAPLIGSSEKAWLTSPVSRALSGLALLWLLAVAVGSVQLSRARSSLLRRHAGAVLAQGAVRQRAEQIARGLGIPVPRLLISTATSLPFSMGYRVPTVVLPASAAGAAELDLDFMLQHELSHIARSDTRVAFWVSLMSVVFTLHPTARRLAREIAFAREASVDAEVAASSTLEYARFLLRAVESARAGELCCNPAVVSMAGTALTRRIDMLTSKAPHRSPSAGSLVSLAVSALALSALVGVAPSSWGASDAGNAPDASDKPGAFSPRLRDEPAGRLPPDTIRRVVREHYGAFRLCYEELPKMVPTRATLRFTIGTDGHVAEGQVAAEIAQLGQCLERAMFTFVFPAPVGGVVTVGYPLVFEPG